jgi:hypothetical protein
MARFWRSAAPLQLHRLAGGTTGCIELRSGFSSAMARETCSSSSVWYGVGAPRHLIRPLLEVFVDCV